MELAQSCAQWQAFVLVMLNLQILLPEIYIVEVMKTGVRTM
jgi:hypothetical protein